LEINAKRPNTGSDQKAKEHHEDEANQKAAKCNLWMGTCTNSQQTMQNGMSIAVLRLCSQFRTMNAGEGTRRNAGSDFSKSPIHFPNVSCPGKDCPFNHGRALGMKWCGQKVRRNKIKQRNRHIMSHSSFRFATKRV